MYISEILFCIGICSALLICCGIVMLCGKYPVPNDDEVKRNAVIKRNIWIRTSAIWLCFYYWLVLNSILTTLIVLYISCYENMNLEDMKIRVFAYSAISLFSSVCPYIVNILDVSRAYRRAFRLIDDAIFSNGNMANALRKGEKIIEKEHK